MSDALAAPLIPVPAKKSKPDSTITHDEQEEAKINADLPVAEDPHIPIEEIDIPDDQIMDIITQIENENREMIQDKLPEKRNQIVNVSNVSNIANVNCRPLMPSMYFPNSNVTINYHFHTK